VINTVAFPTFSNVQSDARALQERYRRTLQLVGALAFPASVGAALVAPVFVPVVLGSQWVEMVPVMQVLSLTTVFHTVGAGAAPLFQAVDRPDLLTKIKVVVLVALGALILPLIEAFGLVGAGIAVMASVAAAAPIKAVVAARILEGGLVEQVAPLAPSAAATLGMAAVVAPLVPLVPVSAFGLAGLIAAGVVAYVAATALLDLVGAGTFDLAREMVTAVRG
jgi:O-antigen/teichoic acid export membrane protein